MPSTHEALGDIEDLNDNIFFSKQTNKQQQQKTRLFHLPLKQIRNETFSIPPVNGAC
jgi:hypothetical protein